MLTTVSRTTTVSMTQRRSAAPVRVKQQRQGVRFGRKEQRRAGVVTAGLFGLGLPEIVVIGGVAAVLFGPQKLPELGKSLGKTVKSFQEAAKVRVILRRFAVIETDASHRVGPGHI